MTLAGAANDKAVDEAIPLNVNTSWYVYCPLMKCNCPEKRLH